MVTKHTNYLNYYTISGFLAGNFSSQDRLRFTIPNPLNTIVAKGSITGNAAVVGPNIGVSLESFSVKKSQITLTAVSASPASVAIGATNYNFASFTVSAADAAENVKITQMNVTHTTSSTGIQNNLSVLKVVADGAQIPPGISPSPVGAISTVWTFNLHTPITIAKGSSKTISIVGDISSGQAGQTHSFSCSSSSCLSIAGVSTGFGFTVGVSKAEGPIITLK